MAQDYNATLNLPKTDFPMRAGLPKREPDWLKGWEEKDLYGGLQQRGAGKPRFLLHDGPPFSNGYIHMGTALNKCLKDFINRYKAMTGYLVTYNPGWDNHGMPIESAIVKQQKLNRKAMSIPEFRDACHEFAQKYVDIQMGQFKRLGVLADWDHPYRTMDAKFEAEEVKVFGKMYEKGYIYKGKKPVYWCPKDETALAEAEIEYSEEPCTSIYVKFEVTDCRGELAKYEHIYFVIWTTTTWTIPGNLAICLNADLDYAICRNPENGEYYILAKDRKSAVEEECGLPELEVMETRKGIEFELMRAKHPLTDRESILICGDHVTLDAGTGCVHTAPGHGQEDYEICRKYDQSGKTSIGIVVPVDDRGRMNELAGKYQGLTTDEANPVIQKDLEACGALLGTKEILHQYAHCWRCKSPILYRATDQWFCSVDAFKEEAVAAANRVKWMPDWGKGRMESMIRERADWCISRQRHWGLPIPVFYCEDCGKPVCTPETIQTVSDVFKAEGSNAWFLRDAADLLPKGFTCPHCGKGKTFTKETDTLDGWFDSGSTHIASMELDSPGVWPCDLYLEGGDQYRGWFQSSLLTAVAVKGAAPYRAVLTHGWTVDGEGRAMHKSLGNSVLPDELIPKYGAELLRLWAASADYKLDMRCSDNIFKQLSDKYLKIRNTARYILGNLNGFEPDRMLPFQELEPLDQWALDRLGQLTAKCIEAYESFEFYTVTYAIHNFCVTEMSNFYLDILKDRLYCEAPDGKLRRSAQTAIFLILDTLVRLLAPILSFTAEEIWSMMPHRSGDDPESVMYNDIRPADPAWRLSPEKEEAWDRLIKVRMDVNKALELARGEKIVGKSLDAKVTLYLNGAVKAEDLEGFDLRTLFIVSGVTLLPEGGEDLEAGAQSGVKVKVESDGAPKCARCWTHDEHVGEDPAHPDLCPRCAAVVAALQG